MKVNMLCQTLSSSKEYAQKALQNDALGLAGNQEKSWLETDFHKCWY